MDVAANPYTILCADKREKGELYMEQLFKFRNKDNPIITKQLNVQEKNCFRSFIFFPHYLHSQP